MIDQPGVYKISSDDYHRDPCIEPSLSRSMIQDLLFRSPAHCWYNSARLNPNFQPEEDQKFDLGQAAHALLLEGIDDIVVVEADDWRKKEAGEKRERARAAGRTPLLRRQYEEAKVMVDVALTSITSCPELRISDLWNEGDAELSIFWKEIAPATNQEVWLRARPDWLSKDRKLLLDYKTTGKSAKPFGLGRHIADMGYALQAALYCRGVKEVEGVEPKFVFFFQETAEPYMCSFVGLTSAFIEIGEQQVEYGKFLWSECLQHNQWPGYPNQVSWLDPPAWVLANWEQIAAQIGESNQSGA